MKFWCQTLCTSSREICPLMQHIVDNHWAILSFIPYTDIDNLISSRNRCVLIAFGRICPDAGKVRQPLSIDRESLMGTYMYPSNYVWRQVNFLKQKGQANRSALSWAVSSLGQEKTTSTHESTEVLPWQIRSCPSYNPALLHSADLTPHGILTDKELTRPDVRRQSLSVCSTYIISKRSGERSLD